MDLTLVEGGAQDVRIGPGRSWVTHLCLINPLTWVLLAGAAYGASSFVRTRVYHLLGGVVGRRSLVWLYSWYAQGNGWVVSAIVMGGIIGVSYMVYRATQYRVDECHVYRRTGLISIYDDPIALAQILDANMIRGPFQRIFGTGTLILQVADQGSSRMLRQVKLHYVCSPDDVHAFIKQRYGGRSARIIL